MASKTIAESSNRSSPEFLSLLDVEVKVKRLTMRTYKNS